MKSVHFARIIFVIAAVAVIAAVSLWQVERPPTVKINVYGQEKFKVSSNADKVEELLQEEEIEKNAGDKVLPSPYYPLEDELEIKIIKELPIEEQISGTGFLHTKYAATLAEIMEFDAPRIIFGPASWYGHDFHGRVTASGEIYDMYGATAAHRYLPLGIEVKVTFLETDKSTIVSITDRGPYVGDRIIDLSKRVAEKIGLKPYGVEDVRLEILPASVNN